MPQPPSRPFPAASGEDRIQVAPDLFHDLSNTLIIVLGSLDLLDRQPLGQEARRQFDRAQQSTERAGQLVRQAFAAAQADHARKNAEAVALSSAEAG